jgi:hypothetical protein
MWAGAMEFTSCCWRRGACVRLGTKRMCASVSSGGAGCSCQYSLRGTKTTTTTPPPPPPPPPTTKTPPPTTSPPEHGHYLAGTTTTITHPGFVDDARVVAAAKSGNAGEELDHDVDIDVPARGAGAAPFEALRHDRIAARAVPAAADVVRYCVGKQAAASWLGSGGAGYYFRGSLSFQRCHHDDQTAEKQTTKHGVR